MEAFLGRDPGYVTSKDGYSQTILHAAALQDHLDIMALAMQHVRTYIIMTVQPVDIDEDHCSELHCVVLFCLT